VARSGREQYLQALASLSELTKAQAERVAALLAKQGEVQSAQVGRVAEDLIRRTQKNREIMTRLVQREVKRQFGLLGMATRDEVARLHQRVRALEQELERANRASASTAGTAKAPASKAASSRTKAASAGAKATRSRSTGTRRTRATKPTATGDDGG
jgi:polyhydroxyalkanoate synthesis regulator phasin